MTVRDVRTGGRTFRLRESGEGRTLLFLHGLGSDGRDIERDLGTIDGYRLVAVDQRGHGESTPVEGMGEFGLDTLADDLDALLEHVPCDAVLGGGSMGAAVLTRWALRHPDSTRTLLVVVPALGTRLPDGIGIVETFVDRVEAWGRDRAAEVTRAELVAQGLSPSDADNALSPWLRQPENSLVVAMRSVLAWHLIDEWSELGRITSPVAIVAVEGDPLHPVQVARRYSTELGHACLRVIESPLEAAQPGRLGQECAAALAMVNGSRTGGYS